MHRGLRAPPERVYRAFLDPAAKAKWMPPNGFTASVQHMDARAGGTYRMTFTNFSSGTESNVVQEGVPGVIPLEACYLAGTSR